MGSKEWGVWEERDSKTRDLSKWESVKPLEGRTRMEKSRLLSLHPRLTSPTAHQHPRCRGRPAGVRGASEGHEGTIVRQPWGGRAGRNCLLQRAALCHYPVCRWTTQKTCEQLGGSKNKWTGGRGVPRLSSARNSTARPDAGTQKETDGRRRAVGGLCTLTCTPTLTLTPAATGP